MINKEECKNDMSWEDIYNELEDIGGIEEGFEIESFIKNYEKEK